MGTDERLPTHFLSPTSSTMKRTASDLDADEAAAPSKRFDNKLELAYPSKSSSSGSQVPFQQPTPLTTFSYDSKRVFRFDDSALRYYIGPPHGADLRHGYERWIKKPEEKGRLDGLLKAWLKIRNGFPDGFMNGGVIAWRGVMVKYVKARDHLNWMIFMVYERILTAPYEEREGWQLNVMCVNGTLYFEEHITDAKLLEK